MKPTLEYWDCMPVTLGAPAWVFPVGALKYEQTEPVTLVNPYTGQLWPTFETRTARYEASDDFQLPYPCNAQRQDS